MDGPIIDYVRTSGNPLMRPQGLVYKFVSKNLILQDLFDFSGTWNLYYYS